MASILVQYKSLGKTDIKVSEICLGTMTWGEQNTSAEANSQMDYCVDRGINFFDTAEMYPVDVRPETYGHTEEIIGNWISERGCRNKIILASKLCGPGRHHVRDGKCAFTKKNIITACEGSLRRLKTDYIDLYQLHWPDRGWTDFSNYGQTEIIENNGADRNETLAALDELMRDGKIRSWGLSNESSWGTMDFIARAEIGTYARPVSIQNAYSLLNRKFEFSLAEVSLRENVSLLAYAPIAAGVLTGKYLDGKRPAGARNTLWPSNQRYFGLEAQQATSAYVNLAEDFEVSPAILAHAFVLTRPFLTSSIIGATKIEHLDIALKAIDYSISDDLAEKLQSLHRKYLAPAP